MPGRVRSRVGVTPRVSVGPPAGGEGIPHPQVAEIQRSRLLSAAVRAVEELGYTQATVAHITRRARVSRRTFYELFSNREECLIAALESVVDGIRVEIAAAGLEAPPWRERVRGGLWTILSFLLIASLCSPGSVWCRLCVVRRACWSAAKRSCVAWPPWWTRAVVRVPARESAHRRRPKGWSVRPSRLSIHGCCAVSASR